MTANPAHEHARWNRWLVTVAIVMVGVLLLIGIPITISMVVGRRALSEQIKPLLDAGEPLTFDEWFAQHPPRNDVPNFADILEPLDERLKQVGQDYHGSQNLPIFGKARPPSIGQAWPAETLAAIDEFLTAQADLLETLEPIEANPYGRFDWNYEGNPLAIILHGWSELRAAARIEALAALDDAHNGRLDNALGRIAILHHLAGANSEDPLLIPVLVSMSIESLLVRSLEQILAVHELDAASLIDLQQRITDRNDVNLLYRGLHGERIGQIAMYEYARQRGTRELTGFGPASAPVSMNWPLSGIVDLNLAKALGLMKPMIDALDSPRATIDAAKAMAAQFPLPMQYFLVNTLMPSLTRACELGARRCATLRCAMTALAAERYSLDHDRWPERLADLTPDYLEAVPADPFDDQPLRFRIDPDRIIIYSISQDLVDDGGDVEQPPGNRSRRPDVGFQLLNPELRGFSIDNDTSKDDAP